MPRPINLSKLKSPKEGESGEAPKVQSTLSKFFSFKSPMCDNVNGKKSNEVSSTESNKKYEASPPSKKRQQNAVSPGSDTQTPAKKQRLSSPDNSRTTTLSKSPGKVSSTTLTKLASFAVSVENASTSADSNIPSLDDVKEKLGFSLEKLSDSLNQDSDIRASNSHDVASENEDQPGTSGRLDVASPLGKFSRTSNGLKGKTQTQKATASGVSTGKNKYTPLEQQFIEIKKETPDAILFVECGYKYRFFGEDAEIAAKELNIYCHLDHSFMTASIPTHRLHVHVRRLVAKGYKVGVVKQTETAALKAAGDNRSAPFTRKLSGLYTKATLIGEDVDPVFASGGEGGSAASSTSSYLMAICEPETKEKSGKTQSIAIVGVQPSTGDVLYDVFDDGPSRAALETRISHISPAELLVPLTLTHQTEKLISQVISVSMRGEDRLRLERLTPDIFDHDTAVRQLSEFYKNGSSTEEEATQLSFILKMPAPVLSCLNGLLHYLKDFNLHNLLKLTSEFHQFSEGSLCMQLPARTVQNLELFQNETDGRETGSLFSVINQTKTRFGERLLRKWLAKPLLKISDIEARLKSVKYILEDKDAFISRIQDTLSKLPDIEKGLGTIYHKKCSTGEFVSVCNALETVAMVMKAASSTDDSHQGDLLSEIRQDLPVLLEDIKDWVSAINETAARSGDKTQLFVNESDFPAVLDRKQEISSVMEALQDHRQELRKILRVSSLDFVNVQGTEFLIEVKNNNLKLVPKDWMKINSTKAVSRYHSPFIASSYKKLSQLREQLKIDCEHAWQQFLQSFESCYPRYKKAVHHLAVLDCLFSLAGLAKQDGYTSPCFEGGCSKIVIEQGRHPVVSALLGEQEQFVPNNTELDVSGERCMVITGPNMGGKSSYIKQVALIVILAQMGSYVPAHSATLGIVDAIYTRMGAADELFKGRSTFMVELQEASDIIASATPRSLVILDELGRGTSTHDGVAIALATLHHFVEKVKCLTLFVTHYPPLAEAVALYPDSVANYHMSFMVNDESENADYDVITFLYQLVSGEAGSSYGLNVARLANIPDQILQVAAQKSQQLQDEVTSRRLAKSQFLKLCGAESTIMKQTVDQIICDTQECGTNGKTL